MTCIIYRTTHSMKRWNSFVGLPKELFKAAVENLVWTH